MKKQGRRLQYTSDGQSQSRRYVPVLAYRQFDVYNISLGFLALAQLPLSIIIIIPIFGPQREFSGVPCLGSPSVILLGSWKPVRKQFLSDILCCPVSVPYHLLPYDIRLTSDLLSFRFLRGRCPWAHVPIPHQGRYIDICRKPDDNRGLDFDCHLTSPETETHSPK